MALLSKYKLNTDTFRALGTNPKALGRVSKTTNLKINQPVPHKGSIKGDSIDSIITLRGAKLTYLSLIEQVQLPTGREYVIASGMMENVKMDIDIIVDGVKMNFVDALHELTNEISGIAKSRDEFIADYLETGIDLINGQSLFFQQFGADRTKFDNVIKMFKENGARQTISPETRRGNVVEGYKLDAGLPVTAFEVGTVDRTQSARYAVNGVGQGFLNFIDAQIEQFERIAGYRLSAQIKLAEAENSDTPEERVALLKEQAAVDQKLGGDSVNNWAGAQRRYQRKGNTFVKQDYYDLVNMPCGRITVVTKDGPYNVDFWSNKKQQDAQPAANESSNDPL